jgi:hypothetical protein
LVCHGRTLFRRRVEANTTANRVRKGNRGNQKVGRKRISTWVGNLPSWLAIRQWCF